MPDKWVCDTCLVPNDRNDNNCSCCGSVKGSAGSSAVHHNLETQVFLQQKVVKYTDDPRRLRKNYSQSDLKHTVVFVVGSSEMDQLPYSCCDKFIKPETGEVESMYESSLPTPIVELPKMRVLEVSCGALHTALLTSTGLVYTFGCNDMGALGRLTNSDPSYGPLDSEPALVDLRFSIKKVSCGDNHTMFLTFTGNVYFTGGFKDSDGPIGIADYSNFETLTRLDYVSLPTKVPCDVEGSTVVIDMASGENHCVLLCNGGHSMYTFGSNEFNQLLIWDTSQIQNATDNDVDLSVPSNKKLLLTWPQHRTLADVLSISKKTDVEEEDENLTTTLRTRGKKRGRTNEELIAQVFTGNCTTFFQTKSLRVYGAGRNAQGEVGVGSEENVVTKPKELTFFRGVELTQLSGGQFFTIALVNNYVFTWGKFHYLGISENYHNPNYITHPHVRPKEEERKFYLSPEPDYEEYSVSKRRRLEEVGNELDNLDLTEKLLSLDYESMYKRALNLGKATMPLLVEFKEPIKAVFNGSDNLFAATYDGTLYAWGSAQNYTLGNGKDYFFQYSPEIVSPFHLMHCKITGGSGGSQHTVILGLKKRSISHPRPRY
ncbi:regulator of chromosome condensation protein, putative [Theileria annulata]|uniref:Regulator of chromosome condensation protein, putative n=1 Tax=Theileria annulata TaxID=5874 RepID=Q4UBA4_THEAN|nr:regulator of chromosome condensation protein, putative [Theileria annulata]CAI75897.1 regulator of chromosome condensation protein, putative [Theileria annulata]|eukprot:XP_955373.1 regulator of chromosome condensation protein, putative [Theileria annulata]